MERIFGETIVAICKKCQTALQKIVDKQEGDYLYCPTCNNCQMQGTAPILKQCPTCKNDYDEWCTISCPFCERKNENDNVLIRQKDYILNLINNRRFSEARCCLTLLCELWTKYDYKYKYDELQRRIKEHTPRREVED